MKLVDDTGTERDFFFEMSKYSAFLYKSHIERHLALYDLYKKTVELPGSVAEFGLYNGSTFYFLARLIEIFHGSQSERHSSTSHHLYGFEVFEGIGVLHENDDILNPTNQKCPNGFIQDKEVFFRDLEFFKSNTSIAKRVHVIDGDVRSTFPKFLEENKGVRFRFILMDLDVYEPTKIVLDLIMNRMIPGAIIVFDEYGFSEWAGESKAVDEFIEKYRLKLVAPRNTFAPAAYTIIE